MILYWVTTEDHYEDWFVLAPSTSIATNKKYANALGCNLEIQIVPNDTIK